MFKKLFAALFAAVGICTAAAAVYISSNCTDLNPQLLTPPTEAKNKVVMLMEAVCEGNYDQASQTIWGNPDLGMDREASGEVGAMIWSAFQDSISYELVGECYTTQDGLAQDVVVTSLEIASVTGNLRERSQNLLEQRVREAEDTSDIYDENNEYREDFVMDVLYDAALEALEQDAATRTVSLTIRLRYSDGWWILGDNALINAISGGIMY